MRMEIWCNGRPKQTVIAQSSAACEMLALNYTMLKAIEIKTI